ncbi:MAG: sugar transferase [Caulobacterales bacterium]|nr:sugar transferase [Caulobacterales bacterium]
MARRTDFAPLAPELKSLSSFDPEARDVPRGIRGPLKRALDLCIAIPALVFVSPLLLVLWALIRMQDGGPALFRQQRIGLGGAPFTCYKLRSMVIDAPQRLQALLQSDPKAAEEFRLNGKLFNDPRITPLGNFLRKTSLDELPQLINVIRGDMSIVGPRPIQHYERELYHDLFSYYAASRPGITGLWQVSGRNDVSMRERCELDATYARDWTIKSDLIILLRTVPAVLNSRGAY